MPHPAAGPAAGSVPQVDEHHNTFTSGLEQTGDALR